VLALLILGVLGLQHGWADRGNGDEPPASELRTVQTALDGGHTMAMLDGKGMPKWYHKALGGPGLASHPVEPGTLILKAWDRCLLELLPTPPAPGFRFEAELRLDSLADGGSAGIYLGCCEHTGPAGPEVWYAHLTIDKENQFGGERVFFRLHRQEVATGNSNTHQFMIPLVKNLGRKTWNQLAVEVTPGKVAVFCNQNLLKEVPEEDFNVNNRRMLYGDGPYGKEYPEWFTPRGGLGLYGLSATVSFRNVTVIPLDR
jgi:hypothetical protein